MPEYQAPGVYVEEVDTGIKTIEGVSTSVAGMVGVTRRGPTRGLPQLVTSFAEFERLYGGYFDFPGFAGHNFLPHAVNGFFTNGGRQLYVARVAPTGATKAEKQAKGGVITRLAGDVADHATTFRPLSLLGIEKGTKVRLRMVKDGQTFDSLASSLSEVQSINRSTGEVTVAPPFALPTLAPVFFSQYSTVFTDRGLASGADPITGTRATSVTIRAKDPGSWGRDLAIVVIPQAVASAEVSSVDDTTEQVVLTTALTGVYPNAWIEFDRGEKKVFKKVISVSGGGKILTIDPFTATDLTPQGTLPRIVTVWELKLTVTLGATSEEHPGLTLENVPGKYIIDRLGLSSLIEADVATLPSIADPLHFPAPEDGQTLRLNSGGLDTSTPPGVNEYIGAGAPGDRTGIKALEDIDQISIIAAPGSIDVQVQNALIEQCERLKDRFAILDPPVGSGVPMVVNHRQQFDTKYAALYFPRLRVFDPLTGSNITIPPSGHMAGVYARVDIERGVHKAPANEVVRGIVDFAATINKETQDLLNPSPTNINVFRDFRADGRGLRIWGARVMTSDTSWKYINVRRLFIFLEESIDEGTQWVVFEPNDEPLWARVRQSISAFLTRVWRDGALQGATPEEAFFVKCDHTTMTQDDIDNGRLIAIVGVAPVKPAEFVIIRISQFTAGAAA